MRELGLPKILDVIYVGCPASGKAEGVLELRMALYDIAFSLTLPRCKCSFSTLYVCPYPVTRLPFLSPLPPPPPPPSPTLCPAFFFPYTPFLSLPSLPPPFLPQQLMVLPAGPSYWNSQFLPLS